MVKVVNSDVVMLKKISDQAGNIMKDESLCRNEVNSFENNLGCLIKAHSKQVDELEKERTVRDGEEPDKPLSPGNGRPVMLPGKILN